MAAKYMNSLSCNRRVARGKVTCVGIVAALLCSTVADAGGAAQEVLADVRIPPLLLASETTIRQSAQVFLNALLTRNERALRTYAGNGGIFFEGHRLRAPIREFLYEEQPPWLSVNDIAASGPLVAVVVRQNDRSIIVIYLPKRLEALVGDSAFLRDQWMKSYFACQFDISGTHWRLFENFCFAETDGPYPSSDIV